LIELRQFEDRSHVCVDSRKSQLPAIFFDVLHRVDQDGQPGTVDECDSGKVDHYVLGTPGDHRSERALDTRRDVKVDFSFKRENIYRIGRRHFWALFAANVVPK